VTLLYLAVICLVVAQLLGIYALVSRKADLIFSMVMVAMILGAVTLGTVGAFNQLG
jgi:hypothetical protein